MPESPAVWPQMTDTPDLVAVGRPNKVHERPTDADAWPAEALVKVIAKAQNAQRICADIRSGFLCAPGQQGTGLEMVFHAIQAKKFAIAFWVWRITARF
jgi:hypothetical protein